MSELQDAMRNASDKPLYPPGTRLCILCKGQRWIWVEFQAAVCSETRDARQTRPCKECNGMGIADDARYAMMALQKGKSKDDWKPYPVEEPFLIHGRCGITFPKTYVWTGLDWLEYENPFYVEQQGRGRPT